MTAPLAGLRVLDFCQVWAGPLCGRILGDLGAEVVKVEGVTRMDNLRSALVMPRVPTEQYYNQGSYYAFCNLGKKCVTVDTTVPGGLDLLHDLVFNGGWDVILESFTPRVFENWGLGPGVLAERLPSLIHVSVSAYGHDGPWRDFRAYGNGIEPASGVCSQNGYPGGPPSRSAIALSDPLAGALAASYVLAALRARRRDGRGQHVVLSQYESAVPLVIEPLLEWTMHGTERPRIAGRSHHIAPQGCYRCAGDDNWLVLSCRTDSEWQALCRAIARPDLAADERLAALSGRRALHDAIDAAITAWTGTRDHMAAFHALQAAGVPAMAVLNGKESLLDEHHRARGFRNICDMNGSGGLPLTRQVVGRFQRTTVRDGLRAPRLGEHNAEILGRIGKSAEDLAALEAAGVIGDRPAYALPFEEMKHELTLPLEEEMAAGQVLRVEPDFREVLGLGPVISGPQASDPAAPIR